MGGGDWTAQQVQQVAQVQRAYTEVAPHKELEKPDGIDQAYAWMRTFVPSWLMGIIIVIGALTVLNNVLNKFGIVLITRKDK